ncbi:hypothetical protein BJ138DRAFT_983622, partial [Hygrophoropsis aurantiaca]
LYIRRLQTAHMYPQIAELAVAILQTLGSNCMSSDESDSEAQGLGSSKKQTTYSITRHEWRANAVTRWLRTLDSLHVRLRLNGEWKVGQGAWPHFRTPSLKISSTPAKKGL